MDQPLRQSPRRRGARHVPLLLPRLQRHRRRHRHRPGRDRDARHRPRLRLRPRARDHGLRPPERRAFQPRGKRGAVIAGKFPSRDVVPYWIAQLVGGFGAVLVIEIVYSSLVTDALDNQPGIGIDNWAALVLRSSRRRSSSSSPHGGNRRSRRLEGRHGAVPDRPLHLHGRGHRRAGLGRLVQPRSVARPVLYNQDWGNVGSHVGPLTGGVLGGAIWTFLVDAASRCRSDPNRIRKRREGASSARSLSWSAGERSRRRTSGRRHRRGADRG